MEHVIVLSKPIKREKSEIKEVQITGAMSHPGSLRGLKLYDVMQSDVDSLIRLLPRVTEPPLTEVEVISMDNADFVALATEAVSFLAPSQG